MSKNVKNERPSLEVKRSIEQTIKEIEGLDYLQKFSKLTHQEKIRWVEHVDSRFDVEHDEVVKYHCDVWGDVDRFPVLTKIWPEIIDLVVDSYLRSGTGSFEDHLVEDCGYDPQYLERRREYLGILDECVLSDLEELERRENSPARMEEITV